MSKILVIGHSVLDRIYYKNKLTIKPGGIFHSINTLVSLIEKEDEVYLATHFSDDNFSHFEDIYNNVNLKYSEKRKQIPTVTLNLYDDKERDEKYSFIGNKINFKENIDFSLFDIIYINMVSGIDLDFTDLEHIRNNTDSKIYFDIHTLSRGIDEGGNREFRVIPEIGKWLKNVNVLQMNENEMLTLFGNIVESKIVEKLLQLGVENVIITKGKKGVSLYYKNNEFSIPSLKVNSQNFVGCGDSFGASFCYHFCKKKDLNSALLFANLIAGIITTYQSTNDFKNLKTDIKKYD